MFDGKPEDYKPETETPVLSEVGKVLWDAADYIEKHGWCQNLYGSAKGSVCLRGAIMQVAWRDAPLKHAALRHTDFFMGDGDYGASLRFNDAPGRTKEEVISALRSAARVA